MIRSLKLIGQAVYDLCKPLCVSLGLKGCVTRQDRNLCQHTLTNNSLALDCIYHSASSPGMSSQVLPAHSLSWNLPLRSTYLHRDKEFQFHNPTPVPMNLEKKISEAKERHESIIESLKELTGKRYLWLPLLTCLRILFINLDTAWHLWCQPLSLSEPRLNVAYLHRTIMQKFLMVCCIRFSAEDGTLGLLDKHSAIWATSQESKHLLAQKFSLFTWWWTWD